MPRAPPPPFPAPSPSGRHHPGTAGSRRERRTERDGPSAAGRTRAVGIRCPRSFQGRPPLVLLLPTRFCRQRRRKPSAGLRTAPVFSEPELLGGRGAATGGERDRSPPLRRRPLRLFPQPPWCRASPLSARAAAVAELRAHGGPSASGGGRSPRTLTYSVRRTGLPLLPSPLPTENRQSSSTSSPPAVAWAVLEDVEPKRVSRRTLRQGGDSVSKAGRERGGCFPEPLWQRPHSRSGKQDTALPAHGCVSPLSLGG